MDNKLNYEELMIQLNRIHNKWEDRRVKADHKDSPYTSAIYHIIEELTNDLLIAFENAEVDDT